MVVDRFFYCTTLFETSYIRFKLCEVVRLGIERGNIAATTFISVKLMIVIERNGSNEIRAKDLADGIGKCCLP